MALFNHTTRDLTAKIVFYGPGLCGKTTNLRVLHGQLDHAAKGKLLSLATAQDRTIYFDLLPVELGNIKGYTVRFQLCTVPGQVFYNETRKIVLRGVDGIVFVVDSQASMLSHNLESFQNLRENLRDEKIALETIPVVIQYNKRDLPSALAVATMQEALGFSAYPFVEAVAAEGRGVVETFRLVSKLTFVDLLRRLQKAPTAASEPAAAVLAAATEAVPVLAPPESAETVFVPSESESGAEPGAGAPVQPLRVSEPAAVTGTLTVAETELVAVPVAEPVATAEPAAVAGPATVAGPAGLSEPAVTASVSAAASSATPDEPLPDAGAESGASPVFEEFETDGEPGGWSATLNGRFPGIDDEPTRDTPSPAPGRPGAQDLATTRAIEAPAVVPEVPATTETPSAAVLDPAPEPPPAAGPALLSEAAAPTPGELASLPEDETRPGRPAPADGEERGLEASLTRALRSISEESARREEVEVRLGGRIATLEEELAALRRELAESRSREASMRSLTEALSRRWDSLRRILSEEEPPQA